MEIGFRLTSNSVLPAELLSFEGYSNEMDNTLNWSVVAEINNDRFDIERSENGLRWNKVAEVYGQGNSSTQLDYSYYDENVDCENCYYRLKQVGFDGASEYSNALLLGVEQKHGFNVHPNPATNKVTVDLSNCGGRISVHNSSGQLMMDIPRSVLGKNTLNVATLMRGHYYIVVQVGSKVETKRLVKLYSKLQTSVIIHKKEGVHTQQRCA